jgi:hypothetical protein
MIGRNSAYQFRYIAYAAAHGLSPEAMFRHDRKRRPSAPGLGFVCWMGEQWSTWDRDHNPYGPRHSVVENEAFEAWLRSWCFLRQMGKAAKRRREINLISA